MKEIEAVVTRFPSHELTSRRLHARDETFRAICEDLADAVRALRFWESAGPSSEPRTNQYRELVSELENEIASLLEGSERCASGRG